MAYDKQGILAILASPKEGNNRYIIFRMLVALYNRQTQDEQNTQSTNHTNGKGFNGTDAQFLTDVAQKSLSYQSFCTAKKIKFEGLTEKQAIVVAKRLKKYAGQLEKVANEKMQGKL